MGKKICPICDGPLGIGDFCLSCKRRIKNPLIISSDMHLNVRHSKTEVDCEFHGTPAAPSPGRIYLPGVNPAPPSDNGKRSSSKTELFKTGRTAFFIIMIGIYAILVVGVPFARFAIERLGNKYAAGTMESSSVEMEEAEPGGIRTEELTPQEAEAIGVACDAFYHLPVYKESAVNFLKSWYSEHNYVLDYEENSAVNEIDYYDDESYSRFEDTYFFRLNKDEEDEAGYDIELSSDYVTGEFHFLNTFLKTEEDSKELMMEFETFLESEMGLSAEESGLSERISSIEFTEEGEQIVTDYGYFFAIRTDDGFWVSITSREYPQAAEE